MLLGLVAVGAVAYYFWEKSKSDATKDAATPAAPATKNLKLKIMKICWTSLLIGTAIGALGMHLYMAKKM